MVPALFLAHGSPMIAIENDEYTVGFLDQLGKRYSPKAIVIFTAHWESETLTISSTDDVYETIYDFGGFPPELYRVKYPARGSVSLAARLEERFTKAGIPVKLDSTRGLDHGSWTLLHRVYPEADIPVVQISVNPFLPPSEQYKIGAALRGLGEEDILVIGSGVTVHNLRAIRWDLPRDRPPEAWTTEFDDWLIARVEEGNLEQLFDYANQAPHARMAVPRAEHFVPFYIAMGAGGGLDQAKVLHRSYDFGVLSYLCYQF